MGDDQIHYSAVNFVAERHAEGLPMDVGKFERFGACVDRCESPIERLFLIALLISGDHTFEPVVGRAPTIARDCTRIELGQQVPIGDFRIDFTLTHPDGGNRFAIELDGFAHHGSTPEQFERDCTRQRAITDGGWTVIRFSGREVKRDARRCAGEAMRAANTLVDEEKEWAEANKALNVALYESRMVWRRRNNVPTCLDLSRTARISPRRGTPAR